MSITVVVCIDGRCKIKIYIFTKSFVVLLSSNKLGSTVIWMRYVTQYSIVICDITY